MEERAGNQNSRCLKAAQAAIGAVAFSGGLEILARIANAEHSRSTYFILGVSAVAGSILGGTGILTEMTAGEWQPNTASGGHEEED